MAKKKIKLNIKNAQIAEALNLSKLKSTVLKKPTSKKKTAISEEKPKPKVRLIKKANVGDLVIIWYSGAYNLGISMVGLSSHPVPSEYFIE